MFIVYGLMCLIFGTTFLAIKIGVELGAPPFLFAGSRFFTAGIIVLLAVKTLHGKISLAKDKRRDVCLVGIFMTAVMFGCLYWGEMYVSSGVAALLAATTPLMIALVEWGQGKREGAWLKASGLLISFIGVVTAILPALGIETTNKAILAVCVILPAEAGSVFGTLRAGKVLAGGVSSFVLNGWQMVIGGILLMLLSLFIESPDAMLQQPVFYVWAYLVVFGSLGGHGAYYWLVRRAGALLPSTWTYISPVIAQFVGYYALAEYLTLYSFLGLTLVLGGVFIVSRTPAIESWLKAKGITKQAGDIL